MAKSEHQKLKLIYVMNMFYDMTDEEHGITMDDIQTELEKKGINAERKSVYSDIDELKYYGMDIKSYQEGGKYYYSLVNRDFEIPELKLLIDAVQSCRFITAAKSRSLISKIESLASGFDAKKLHHDVYVAGRTKTMNENIYILVDTIQEAINSDHTVKFRYFRYNSEKKAEYRHEGAYYEISPWALTWNDGNYYLIGYDDNEKKLKHYRVDKMKAPSVTDQRRTGKSVFSGFSLAEYEKSVFGMYGGTPMNVKIRFDENLAGVVIDKFGSDIVFAHNQKDPGHFTINVKVEESMQFYAWVFGLGEGALIISPQNAVKRMKDEAKRLAKQYK